MQVKLLSKAKITRMYKSIHGEIMTVDTGDVVAVVESKFTTIDIETVHGELITIELEME